VSLEEGWNFTILPPAWWKKPINPFSSQFKPSDRENFIQNTGTPEPVSLLEVEHEGEKWIALSGYWYWKEFTPITLYAKENRELSIRWYLQSFLVTSKNTQKLLEKLSSQEVEKFRFWYDYPECILGSSQLNTYPTDQNDLRAYCEFASSNPKGSWITTVIYQNELDRERQFTGYLPSPQLMDIGNLRYSGTGFDFHSAEEK